MTEKRRRQKMTRRRMSEEEQSSLITSQIQKYWCVLLQWQKLPRMVAFSLFSPTQNVPSRTIDRQPRYRRLAPLGRWLCVPAFQQVCPTNNSRSDAGLPILRHLSPQLNSLWRLADRASDPSLLGLSASIAITLYPPPLTGSDSVTK